MNKAKNKFFFPVSWFLAATVALYQLPGIAVESTKEIQEDTIPAVMKSETKSIKNMNLEVLRQQLRQTKNNESNFSNKVLSMGTEFNAFPKSSTIDLTLRDMDIPSVLRIIAKEGGKNIILDESVGGTISAELKKISLNEAMQIILTSQELEARAEGNTIFVASRPAMAKKGLNRKVIKAFKLNNSNAVEVAKILEASIFNKGYAVNDTAPKDGGVSLQSVANPDQIPAQQSNQTNPAANVSSTGQSSIINSKTIKGRVESLTPGTGFEDANTLASAIKIQNVSSTIQDIEVNNNDGGAIVIPDTRTNSILVAGLNEDILMAEEAIKYLDKPLPQVAIEVSLLELTRENTDHFGYSIAGSAGNTSLGFDGMIKNFTNGVSFSTVGRLADDINIQLNALISSNKAKLLANPTVITLDGSESLIKITDQIVSRMTVTAQVNGPTTYTPELSDIGIVLNILPKVGNNGYVTMRVRPSITTFLKEVTFGQNGYANLISTREVILQDTRVKAGETLAIAGLLKESDIEKLSKVPLAGDLPVFGKLFRGKQLDHSKSEIVVLITPRIIDDIATN